ncbi:conserved hypothetical protein [Gluconacetobacter diazotrophicus PA1 5]|uniref:Uncharacterized protein n=2 Tax=Gluconacetobacter diazotrophicus TaxID=33996 RepID=A0A7W4I931_GLUDI|nr:DUF6328 family protein [Gluconacetobacter diazotrophicus]ACI51971.1 conserved hypothetical protein [Gluconacetobacter diazotrophicus PA1 5]MBB2158479.1 hypothetical protein [Gluconacetobacter diazotrophicus]TWB05123.1 hypothetical protein FBZ86_11811 [Gluconacetobacter diazotrophicus]CAP55461.1 putative membrane protein [Gluconacetobacter diazotrophicus PA1 5]
MALHDRVKTALDEARTLILGAQILLGFQYQAAFQERFDTLPPPARIMATGALGLMLVTVGLLIAPSAFHRIAEHGRSTGRIHMLIGRLAAAALLPFAAAFGLDVAIATDPITGGGLRTGIMAGTGLTAAALAGWYGAGMLMRQRTGVPERQTARAEQNLCDVAPLHARVEQMLTEARVILPGAQALLGFQLTMVLTTAFEKLPAPSRLVHGGALLCVAMAVILLIMPAALHRIVWAGENTERLLRIGGGLTATALVPLALGLSGESYVVATRIIGSRTIGLTVAVASIFVLIGLWFIWPMAARRSAA